MTVFILTKFENFNQNAYLCQIVVLQFDEWMLLGGGSPYIEEELCKTLIVTV